MLTLLVVLAAALTLGPFARVQAAEGTESSTRPSVGGDAEKDQEATGTAAETQGEPGEPGMLPDAAEGDPAAQKKARRQTVVGRVTKIEGNSLTLKSTELGDPHELTIRKNTRLTHEGEAISRDRIETGDQVRATFVGAGASGPATEIAVIQKAQEEAVQGAAASKDEQGTGSTGQTEETDAPPEPSGN